MIEKLIDSPVEDANGLSAFKKKTAKEYKISLPKNMDLLKAYHDLVENKKIKRITRIENLLQTRPVRSLSGIVNVSVLTKPYPCPGKCIFCPLEKGIPKSYLSGEPAVERAKKLNYDPYLQVQKRIEMLQAEGHPVDKIELRIVGGTWSCYAQKYQGWFVKRCFEAGNQKKSRDLKTSQRLNEKAKYRIIGISIETRPDYLHPLEIKHLRKLGVTMVEIGVQSIDDRVLKLNKRGHKIKETIAATKILKEAGFKVLYQMMPNLLGSNLKKDEKTFEELFKNPDFQPDFLKIYPCALLKETPLYKLYLKGQYEPYSAKQLINLIKAIKKNIPYYVRIQRIIRDIPSQKIITGGAKISNLRQLVAQEMEKEGKQCQCIRCREVKKNYNPREKLYLFRQDYLASGGKEIFLSFESADRKLYALLRLRLSFPVLNNQKPLFPVLEKAAIIREIHTYGQLVPIGNKSIAPQHRGLGKKLIKEAEKITQKEFGLKKIAIIAGVGVRSYFRRQGFRLKETYMVKNLSKEKKKGIPSKN